MALSVATFQIFCRDQIYYNKDQRQSRFSSSWVVPAISDTSRIMRRGGGGGRKLIKRDAKVEAAFWQDTKPTAIELEAIADMDQFDRILLEAQEQSQPIVVDWMAAWCRKCIFLKPKLEKLAAEYHTRLNFYYVDVNNVSQALVKRGNISKMPTIQLWKGGEMKEEVIGGHKAWLVIDQVREMIQKHI